MKSKIALEKHRHLLALKGDLEGLRKTYEAKHKLFDRNKPKFWDKLLTGGVGLSKQDPMTRDRIKIALGFLPGSANKVLDIGAGYGFIEELIQKEGRKISLCGIDISPSGAERLNSKFGNKFKVGDIRKIPYPSNSFDAIFVLEVLEHIAPAETFLAFNEVKRVLRPGGILIISVPTNETVDGFSKNPSGHLRIYTPELIRAELSLAGFEFVKWKKLYAFSRLYKLKSLVAWFLPKKFHPNNVVIKAKKMRWSD